MRRACPNGMRQKVWNVDQLNQRANPKKFPR
jgi:hypothetical protein